MTSSEQKAASTLASPLIVNVAFDEVALDGSDAEDDMLISASTPQPSPQPSPETAGAARTAARPPQL